LETYRSFPLRDMDTENRPQGEPGHEFLGQLPAEVEHWRQERLIGARHAAAILRRYGLPTEALERRWRLGRTISILAILGAILIGIGIILLIASNRQEFDISRGAKVALIMGSTVFLYLVGYVLKYELAFPRVGGAIIFLAAVFYGAAVFLIGQVYNVQANDPRLLLYWFVGVIPLAYITRSAPILALSLLVASAGLGMRAATWLEDTHPGELAAIRTIPLYVMLGVLFHFLAPLHERFEPLRGLHRPLLLAGLMAVMVGLYLLGFQVYFEDLHRDIPDMPASLLQMYALLTALAVAAVASALYVSRRALGTLPQEAAVALVLVGMAFATLYVPFKEANAYVVLYNGLLLAVIFGTTAIGVASGREEHINIALAFFAVLVITRYFDWGWGLYERSLFFMGAGALVLAGAFLLEFYRRRLLRRVGTG
jgi:uncharacterized membrane protein